VVVAIVLAMKGLVEEFLTEVTEVDIKRENIDRMGPLSERHSILPRFQRGMGRESSIFLLYMFVMLIFAFMLRSLLSSPYYYAILLMLSILVFILMYPVPNIYSAAEYSIVNRPMRDRFDQLEWYNEKQSEKPSEPKMPIVPKPIIISKH